MERRKAVAQAYQCDKCQTFYTDEPNLIQIYNREGNVVLQKDICDKCREELENLFRQQDYRYRW
jgi:hypothetical protein